ncbi:MAG: DUF2155 domain-containing protein [Novosphingobium sp.]
MKRAAAYLPLFVSLSLLAACGGGEPKPEDQDTSIPDAIAGMQAGPAQAERGQHIGTPNKDRVVTLGVLNKRNNLTQDLVMKPGESKRLGNLVVKVATCEKTLPWEHPEEEGAFVQVFVEERASAKDKLAWHKVFSGWLFRNSPGLNVVEHPVYDVWVKACAMKFPGEDASPAASASSRSAAKASGRPSTSPAPSAATPEPPPEPD